MERRLTRKAVRIYFTVYTSCHPSRRQIHSSAARARQADNGEDSCATKNRELDGLYIDPPREGNFQWTSWYPLPAVSYLRSPDECLRSPVRLRAQRPRRTSAFVIAMCDETYKVNPDDCITMDVRRKSTMRPSSRLLCTHVYLCVRLLRYISTCQLGFHLSNVMPNVSDSQK